MEFPPGYPERKSTPEEINAWMIDENNKSLNTRCICWTDANVSTNEPESICTARLIDFRDGLPKREWGLDFHGCTILMVVSHKAAYIAHYWETLVFWPDDEDLETAGFKDHIASFDSLVGTGLQKGIEMNTKDEDNAWQQHPLKGYTDIFKDEATTNNAQDDVHGYLIIPHDLPVDGADECARIGSIYYYPKWNSIRRIVDECFAESNLSIKWHEHKYEAVEDSERENNAKGRVMFKYHPNHGGKQRYQIWVGDEGIPIADEVW